MNKEAQPMQPNMEMDQRKGKRLVEFIKNDKKTQSVISALKQNSAVSTGTS